MDREDRAFDAASELRVGHHDRDLDDAIGFREKTGHLEVDPDQVLLVARQGGIGCCGHGSTFEFVRRHGFSQRAPSSRREPPTLAGHASFHPDDRLRRSAGHVAAGQVLARDAPDAARRGASRRGAARLRRHGHARIAPARRRLHPREGSLRHLDDGVRRRSPARLDAARRHRRAEPCAARRARATGRQPRLPARAARVCRRDRFAARPAVRALQHLPARAALRLQPDDLAALRRRRLA